MVYENFGFNLSNRFKFPPCALIICLNFLNAFPELRIFLASFIPSPFFDFPASSNKVPAKKTALLSKSRG